MSEPAPRLAPRRPETDVDESAATWTSVVDDGTEYRTRSDYFGSNIPGKPRRCLLNAGGRPKFFKEIARVRETDFKAFRLSRSASPGNPPRRAAAAGAP